jgi:hypothetical protein
MKFLALFAILAAPPADAAHPSWMVGTWGWQNAGEKGNDCRSDHATTYFRDGTFEFIGQAGTWRIEGSRLIETVTDPGEAGDPADRGKSTAIHFKRLRPGVLQVAGEYPGKMIKCPPE